MARKPDIDSPSFPNIGRAEEERVSEVVTESNLQIIDDAGQGIVDFSILHNLGFSEEKTIKIGDPENGGVQAYIGLLVGPAPDIQVQQPGQPPGVMKCWAMHPLNMTTLEPNRQTVHRVICAYSLNESFTRMYMHASEKGLTVIAGAQWLGKRSIQAGRKQMNEYQIFERYLGYGEVLAPVK